MFRKTVLFPPNHLAGPAPASLESGQGAQRRRVPSVAQLMQWLLPPGARPFALAMQSLAQRSHVLAGVVKIQHRHGSRPAIARDVANPGRAVAAPPVAPARGPVRVRTPRDAGGGPVPAARPANGPPPCPSAAPDRFCAPPVPASKTRRSSIHAIPRRVLAFWAGPSRGRVGAPASRPTSARPGRWPRVAVPVPAPAEPAAVAFVLPRAPPAFAPAYAVWRHRRDGPVGAVTPPPRHTTWSPSA